MEGKYPYEISCALLNAELFDCLVGMPELFCGNVVDGHFYWTRNTMIFSLEPIDTPKQYLESVLYKVHCKSIFEGDLQEPCSVYYKMN